MSCVAKVSIFVEQCVCGVCVWCESFSVCGTMCMWFVCLMSEVDVCGNGYDVYVVCILALRGQHVYEQCIHAVTSVSASCKQSTYV